MNSHINRQFRLAFQALPVHIRKEARKAYKQFEQNPYHPSLRFKLVHPTKPIYSVRISVDYRALAVRQNNDLIWFWIGTHTDYDKLISRF